MRLALAALLLAAPAAAQEEGAGTDLPARLRTGGFQVFNDTKGPMSFVALPAKPAGATDLGEVKGRSCQYGLSIPLAASLRASSVSGAKGDGGYDKALEKVRKERPELVGVYDVRADMRVTSVLGVFRRLCVEVTARAFR